MSNAAPVLSTSALQLEVARLRAECEKLKAGRAPKVSLKVSPKGALSVYGMGQWPTTLYRSQWETLLDKADEIRAFIAANADRLKTKE